MIPRQRREFFRSGFWRSLRWNSYIIFLLGVFFTFSIIGFCADLFEGGRLTGIDLISSVIFSGMVAVGYAFAATRNLKYLPLVILIHLLIQFFLVNSEVTVATQQTHQTRLMIDGMSIILCMVLGYIFFIIFISREGIHQFRMSTEIALAREIHEVLVPPLKERSDKFEVFGKSVPASEVGGDLLDVYQNQQGLTCYVADVSGHGVSAGVLMGMFKSAARMTLLENKSLKAFVNNINVVLHSLKKKNMFITFAGIRFGGEEDARATVCGHLPILHFLKNTGQVKDVLLKQIPLGVQPGYQFETIATKFQSGDVFALITDGLTEVVDKKDRELGIEPIRDLLRKNAHLPLKEIYHLLMSRVISFGKQRDDQTLMLIKCL